MKDLSWLKHELIAHRGLHTIDGQVPENSLAAFQKAMDAGYAIELDVNVLKDGTVLTFHDPSFERLCRDKRLLREVDYEDMQDLYLLASDERPPRLEDVVRLVAGKVPLLIELKPFGDVLMLAENVMRIMKDYPGTFAIFSFHPKIVGWFKKHHPDVIRGQISESFAFDPRLSRVYRHLLRSMFFNRFTKPDFVSYSIRDLPNRYLDKAKKKGLTVISFAAQTQAEFDFVKTHYDNVVFEFFKPVYQR